MDSISCISPADSAADEESGSEVATSEPDSSSAAESAGEMQDMESMSELYEESLRRVQEGEVVKGRIVSITKDYVMVDIGYKSEGQIPIHEFTLSLIHISEPTRRTPISYAV